MRCARARRLALGRREGRIEASREAALTRHLQRCAACAAVVRTDDAILRALASLREEVPPEVDVRRRVVGTLARVGRVERNAVSVRELGWSAAAALGAVATVGVGLGATLIGQRAALRQTGAVLAALTDVLQAVWDPVRVLLSVAWDLAGTLVRGLAALGGLAELAQPVAGMALATGYIVMLATVASIVCRDFLRRSPAVARKES